jgi:hypothetical protein
MRSPSRGRAAGWFPSPVRSCRRCGHGGGVRFGAAEGRQPEAIGHAAGTQEAGGFLMAPDRLIGAPVDLRVHSGAGDGNRTRMTSWKASNALWLATCSTTASCSARARRDGGSPQAAVRPFSTRSAIQSLMMDWRVTPSRGASRSSDSIIHDGKSTLTRRCSSGDGGSRRGPDRIYMPPRGARSVASDRGRRESGPHSQLGRHIAHPRPTACRSSTPRARVAGQGQRAGCRNCATVWLGRSYSPGLAD